MPEYIDRQEIIDMINAQRRAAATRKDFIGMIVLNYMLDVITNDDCVPAADVRPERHGRIVIKSRVLGGVETYKCPQCYHKWQENNRARVDETLCSECGAVLAHSFQNYCPRCGAKMDEEEGDKND